jgi:hypothetical protein
MGLGSQTRFIAFGVPFQPMQHRQDADATERTAVGNPLSVPPIPSQDCDHGGTELNQAPEIGFVWRRSPAGRGGGIRCQVAEP